MKPSEIREKPTTELERMVRDLKEEVFRLRLRHRTGQLKQTANIEHAKKDLARVNTELRVRETAEEKKGATA